LEYVRLIWRKYNISNYNGKGWVDAEKRREMSEEEARYIVCEASDGSLIGFMHYRFDLDEVGAEISYLYELQIIDSARRRGLGKFMIQILEILSWKLGMQKIVCTCLKCNGDAMKFYKGRCGFSIDEDSPDYDKNEQQVRCEYEILSKPLPPQTKCSTGCSCG